MTRSGKKVCILGASIVQRLNMKEFNRCLQDSHAVRLSFPGATVSKVAYYMKPTIEEEKPDTVLINIGKPNQKEANRNRNDKWNIWNGKRLSENGS